MADKKNTPNQTLYRKYRPQKFADVVGQDHIVKTLTNALKSNRLGHAYLFTGPRGTGKTTVARLFAAAINCEKRPDFTPANKDVCAGFINGKALDLIEIDAASHTGVDNIRDLRETIAMTPNEAPFKVYIIDEVHMLSTGAFNALLKTLEEPPAHAVFILATTDIHKVPETIISRCQRFDFMRMGLHTITSKIQMIAKAENITIDDEAAELVAIAANGGMRDAESLLAQVFALEDKKVTAEQVSSILGTTTNQDVFSLLEAFANKDIHSAIAIITSVVEGGYSISTYTKSLIIKLRALLFYTLTTEKSSIDLLELTTSERENLTTLAKLTSTKDVLTMIQECEKASLEVKSSVIPSMPLEVAAVIICNNKQTTPGETTLQPSKKSAPSQTSQQQVAQTSKSSITSEQSSSTVRQTSVSQISPTSMTTQGQLNPTSIQQVENQQVEGTITIESIKEKWPQLVGNIQKENPSLSSILSNYAPVKIQGSEVVLHVKYELHKEKLMEARNKLTLSVALATIFNESLTIRAIKKQENITPAVILEHAKELLGGQPVES